MQLEKDLCIIIIKVEFVLSDQSMECSGRILYMAGTEYGKNMQVITVSLLGLGPVRIGAVFKYKKRMGIK